MFGQGHSLLITLCFTLKICFEYGQTAAAMNEAQRGAGVSAVIPLNSYYRHNIYGPKTYAFGFKVSDKATDNIQYRDEKRYSNGSVEGSFGYVRPDDSVSITHYTANSKEGYTSQTKIVLPGEEVEWLDSGSKQQAIETTSEASHNDKKETLNLTSILLPVEDIKQRHNIDLSPPELEKELVNPAILEVINGQAPLVKNSSKRGDEGIGFAAVSKFIPPQFHLTPFIMPAGKISSLNGKANSVDGHKSKADFSKDDRQKHDNSMKLQTLHDQYPLAPSASQLKGSQEQKKSDSSTNSKGHIETREQTPLNTVRDYDWSERVINQARMKYLRNQQ